MYPKFMSQLANNAKGFTLIELMVVLIIVSVLSMITIVSYTDLKTRASDSARRSYLNEVISALEVNKTPLSYVPLQSNQLTNFTPLDPQGNVYCIAPNIVADPAFAIGWGGTCPAGFEVIAPGVPTTGNFTEYKICTYLEKPVGATNVYCRSGRM